VARERHRPVTEHAGSGDCNGSRESAVSQWPKAQPASPASTSPSRLNGRRYVSIRVRREIAKPQRTWHHGRSYLPYRYSSAMAIGLLLTDSRDAWMYPWGRCSGRVRAVRGDGVEPRTWEAWERNAARATVTVLLREGSRVWMVGNGRRRRRRRRCHRRRRTCRSSYERVVKWVSLSWPCAPGLRSARWLVGRRAVRCCRCDPHRRRSRSPPNGVLFGRLNRFSQFPNSISKFFQSLKAFW